MNAVVYIHTPLSSRWAQDREREEAAVFVRSRSDLTLVRTYADFGPFEGSCSRRALLSLLRDAGGGAFQALVVRAPRVLAQEPPEILEIYGYLVRQGVQVLFYSGSDYPMRYWARQYERMRRCLAS